MAITRIGSEYSDSGSHLRTSGNHAPSITIPATTEFAIIYIAFFEATTGQHPTTVSLGGQSATFIVAQDDNTGLYQGALYYVPTPSTGTQTLSWDNPVAFDDGVAVRVAFFKGGNITSGAASLVRDSDHAANSSNAVTPTLTAQSGDYTIMGYMTDATAPTFTNGTSFNSSTTGFTSGLVEYSPTGDHTMNCNGGASTSPGIVAAVLKPATSSQTVAIGIVSETDSALAMTVGKLKAIGEPSETDSANVMVANGSSVFLDVAHGRELRNQSNVAWASVNGWTYAWYDSFSNLFSSGGTPAGTGTFNTNGSGAARLEIPATTLAAGQSGALLIRHPDYPTTPVFALLNVPIGP